MKYLLAILISSLVLVVSASAGKPNSLNLAALPAAAGKPQPIPPLSLWTEQSWNNPVSPPWCLNEDDYHYMQWQGGPLTGGFFSGTLTESDYFCSGEVDTYEGYSNWDGGGVGVGASAVVNGTLEQLSLSTEGFREDAELVLTWTMGKGQSQRTYRKYTVCVYPTSESENWSLGSFTGTWTMILRGEFVEVRLAYVAEMFPSARQGWPSEIGYCPQGQLP